MEALSVAGSIVGLVAAGAQLIPMFYNLAAAVKDAPSHAQAAVTEVKGITMVLTQLQKYIDGTAHASVQRLSLIHVENVMATLTECVMTYSELDGLLKTLHVDKGLKAWDRTLWLLKRGDIERLVRRLQNHKSTLGLMLQIIQCATLAEAERSMEHLCGAVSEMLQSNQALAARMQNMERTMSSSMSTRTARTVGTALESFLDLSEQPDETDDIHIMAPNGPTVSDSPSKAQLWQPQLHAFEEQLYRTRVYRHAIDRQSLYSSPSDGRTTLAISLSSSLTLGEVSKISVYALPIFATELSNAQCYVDLPQTSSRTAQTTDILPAFVKSLIDERRAKRLPQELSDPSTDKVGLMSNRSVGPVFGVPLETSIECAFVDIHNIGELPFQCTIRVPIVVAKCGDCLKGKVRHFGAIGPTSQDRLQLLQDLFNSPPHYGSTADLSGSTLNVCANLLLRYLLRMPDSVIPGTFYERLHDLSLYEKERENDELWMSRCWSILSELPWPHLHLLLYILDLFNWLAHALRQPCTYIAAIYHTAILRPSKFALLLPGKEEHTINERVVAWLIEHARGWKTEFDRGEHGKTDDWMAVIDHAEDNITNANDAENDHVDHGVDDQNGGIDDSVEARGFLNNSWISTVDAIPDD